MIRRRNSYTYELYRKQILREIPFKRAFEPLREDVMFLAETVAEMGEEDDVRGLYCAGLINEFGLVPGTDRNLAEKYYKRVLDQVDDGDLFYDRAVDRLAELRGITAVPFNTRYFENEMDNCIL